MKQQDPRKFADGVNGMLWELHDATVSKDPFKWENSPKKVERRKNIYDQVLEQLKGYKYVSKSHTVATIFLYGVLLPLVVLAALWYFDVPADEGNWRLIVWGGLLAVALISTITACVVGSIPSLDEGFMLASYTVPKGWAFSQANTEDVWDKYRDTFYDFDEGSELQCIPTRIWGFMDEERQIPFQMFHFKYNVVTYVSTGKTTIRISTPYHKYGMFFAVPECQVRFRITEVGGWGGMEMKVKLEYEDLNNAVDIYCKSKDELEVRKFLSPAVQEVIAKLSNVLDDMAMNFYPGFVQIMCENDFLENLGDFDLDENAHKYQKTAQVVVKPIEQFRQFIWQTFCQIRKYND